MLNIKRQVSNNNKETPRSLILNVETILDDVLLWN